MPLGQPLTHPERPAVGAVAVGGGAVGRHAFSSKFTSSVQQVPIPMLPLHWGERGAYKISLLG